MSEVEESPAQRAARIRRERREAKIRDSGSARLDKITSLSGRTPTSSRDESPSSLRSATPRASQQHQQPQPQQTTPSELSNAEEISPETRKAQEEYLRAMLRSKEPIPSPEETDPSAKLLNALLANASAAAEDPSSAGQDDEVGAAGVIPDMSNGELAEALKVSPPVAKFVNFLLHQAKGGEPPSPSTQRANSVWKVVHVLFAITISLYFIFALQSSVLVYGGHPPPPATMQNPFVILLTGELLLSGIRIFLRKENTGALSSSRAVMSNAIRDGKIMIFVLGIGSLWTAGMRAKI